MPDSRPIGITTPLAEDALRLVRMSGSEELGRMFRYELELQGDAGQELVFDELLGHDVTVTLDLPEGERFFHGFVTSIGLVGHHRESWAYRAVVSPWLWFLTRRSNCRIFQNMTVPDILREIFSDHGFSDLDDRLEETYRTWEYCVQYRETDFNFVSRLMEQEGIHYYFLHEDGAHTLVLGDQLAAHEAVSGFETLPYHPPSESGERQQAQIDEWTVTQQVQPGGLEMQEFDPLSPTLDLTVVSTKERPNPNSTGEIRDYPGEYVETGDGETYAAIRLEEYQTRFQRASAHTNAGGLTTGALVTLEHHPRDDQNVEHLIISAEYSLENPKWETGGRSSEGESPTFDMTFSAIPSEQRFVTARATPKPIVQGPQTAVVTGPSGEEIHTDEHGRITVQFHWDRLGVDDENSTCWIRVAEAWAGREWGAIHLPRIGQEVIVDFLEGDPDRPIVTGRVYNAENMPPYSLPDNKTQSGIKSRSSKEAGAANFNELRFEDKKGEEHVYLHAEKDKTTEIENDQTLHVMNNRTKNVDNDETNHIVNNRTENVDGDETIDIGSNRTESVSGNEELTVGGNRTETIAGSETRTVIGGITEDVTGSMTQTITGALTQTVVGGVTWTTPASVSISAAGGINLVCPGGFSWTDPFFAWKGAADGSFYAQTRSIVGQQIEIVSLHIGVTTSKEELNGQVLDVVNMKLVNKPMKLGQFGSKIRTGANKVIAAGAALFK